MNKNLKIAAVVTMGVLLAVGNVFAQAQVPAEAPKAPAAPVADAAKELSIYGEVKAVNAAASGLSVQYYDYDSDEEKTAEIVVVKEAKIENAATLNDIKQGDWVDVSYTVVDGKNVAKVVSVEKEEQVPQEAAPVGEMPE